MNLLNYRFIFIISYNNHHHYNKIININNIRTLNLLSSKSSKLLNNKSSSSSFNQLSNNSNKKLKNLIIKYRLYHQRSNQNVDYERNRSTAMLMTALVVIVLGLSYAAVPLYRIYCQKTGTSLQAVAKVDEINEKVVNLKKITDRKIRIKFEAEKSARLAWNFKPSQPSIVCSPGETILAFYTAKNELDRPVNGIATYTILPYEAGKYFNKIQCFCFEEQQLNANEEVDLPVFFFIDPEFTRDPYLFDVNEIILSYNFFETKEGFKLPKPPGFRAHLPVSSTIINKNVAIE